MPSLTARPPSPGRPQLRIFDDGQSRLPTEQLHGDGGVLRSVIEIGRSTVNVAVHIRPAEALLTGEVRGDRLALYRGVVMALEFEAGGPAV